MYIGALEVPEEEGESEQRQVVVGPLKAGEAGQQYDHKEQFLDVLDHLLNWKEIKLYCWIAASTWDYTVVSL